MHCINAVHLPCSGDRAQYLLAGSPDTTRLSSTQSSDLATLHLLPGLLQLALELLTDALDAVHDNVQFLARAQLGQ